MINFDDVVDVEAVAKKGTAEAEEQKHDAISGKVAVATFSVILVLGFIAVLSIGLQFQTIMQRLNASRSAWGSASSELSKRYGEAEQFLSSVDYMGNSPTLTDWKYYYSQFLESRQFDRQVNAALRLEEMLEALLSQQVLPPTAPIYPLQPGSALLDLLEKEKLRKESEQGPLGIWTKTLLRLKTPSYFESVNR